MQPEDRKIAKNGLILYSRLIITTLIGLYSYRIILLQLGADNFGLYSVVGGIVALLNLMNTSMIATSNRFIAVEIGKNEEGDINRVFNTLLIFHILFSLILIVLVEAVGLWYINNYLNIDQTKIPDAIFILHFSVLTTVISTVIIPFQGLITANEIFNVRATIEILRSILHLGAVLLLIILSGNKLRIYVIFILLIQFIEAIIYFWYSSKTYKELVRWRFNKEKKNYFHIINFFGWQMLYIGGNVGVRQGSDLIINLFFGTILNAAFAISSKVNDFVFSFVKNLNQAAVPQIIKSYSGGSESRSLTLIYKLSKYTFYIMLIPTVPIILSIDSILLIWLKKVPPFTSCFVVLRIIHGLISCLESGFDALIDATGKIKRTKISFSIIFLTLLPILYLSYKLGFPPYMATLLFIFGEIIFILIQLLILSSLTEFSFKEYLTNTIMPILFVVILLLPQYLMRIIFGKGLLSLIIISLISISITSITIFFAGLKKTERDFIRDEIRIKLLHRILKNNN